MKSLCLLCLPFSFMMGCRSQIPDSKMGTLMEFEKTASNLGEVRGRHDSLKNVFSGSRYDDEVLNKRLSLALAKYNLARFSYTQALLLVAKDVSRAKARPEILAKAADNLRQAEAELSEAEKMLNSKLLEK